MSEIIHFIESLGERDFNQLQQDGYLVGQVSTTSRMLEIASSLGTPVPMRKHGNIIEELKPNETGDAKSNSLSSRHGLGEFPLHTDCAFWPTPARYLLLRAATDSPSSPTRVVNSDWLRQSTKLYERALNALFKVQNGCQSFLTSMVSGSLIRVDRDCMHPANTAATGLFDVLEQTCPQSSDFEISWESGMCVILDNWRMLHGRADCSNPAGQSRVLHRVLVKGGQPC